LVENRARGERAFRSVSAAMTRAGGPHTRDSMPGRAYRGSRKRIAGLAPFDGLTVTFWVFVAIALLMAGMCAALILDQLERLR
jgi:hypothetical protein